MNTKQKLHQIKLQEWLERFQNQASSGLTVKDWCLQNDISLHTYNYWKHKLKEEYVQSSLPDIVPLSTTQLSTVSINETIFPSYNSLESSDSLNSNTIYVTYGDIHISIGSTVCDEQILRIIKAVRYA